MSHSHVEDHFDIEAAEYDYWKKKNWYYYDALKTIARRYTEGALSVLDAGCGTGGIISILKAKERVGIDISSEMITIASNRHHGEAGLSFVTSDIVTYAPGRAFDAILFFDVIEHAEHKEKTIAALYPLLAPQGTLIVTMANPLWEPILLLAEKLRLKMPEGPHDRISARELVEIAQKVQFVLKEREHALLFPKYIPLVSYVLNNVIGRLPGVRKLAVIDIFVFTKV